MNLKVFNLVLRVNKKRFLVQNDRLSKNAYMWNSRTCDCE